jgi:stress response protein YsnF
MVDVSDELVTQELTAERVAVSRVPVNRYVEVAPQIRTEGELTIIPVLEEVLVVAKETAPEGGDTYSAYRDHGNGD